MPSQHDGIPPTTRASQDAAALRYAVAMLGHDWQLLNPAASSPTTPAAIDRSSPAVLANPAFGVVLLDIAPHASPAAIEQFRAKLDVAGFSKVCPGNLPVVHRVLPPEHLHRLPDIIDYALSWENPITIRPDVPWVATLRDLLTAIPGGGTNPTNAVVSGKMPSDVPTIFETAAVAAPPLSPALLLVGCGLLIAIGGGTAAMWGLLATDPGVSRVALTAGDDFRSTMRGTAGGDVRDMPDLPTANPPLAPQPSIDHAEAETASEVSKLPNNHLVETTPAHFGDWANGRLSDLGTAVPHDANPTHGGTDPGTPASLSGDTPVAKAATVEPEQMPGGDSGASSAALLPPEVAVVVAPAGGVTDPDNSAGAEQPLMPSSSVTDVAPIRPDGMSSRPNEAEAAITLPGPSQTLPQITPGQGEGGTTLTMSMAHAESRAAEPGTGVVPVRPSGPLRPSDALLSNLLKRGDSMLALGNVSAARLFYERAAAAGSEKAATALGKTYDPEALARLGITGVAGDAATAVRWYRTAQILGDAEASRLLDKTKHLRP